MQFAKAIRSTTGMTSKSSSGLTTKTTAGAILIRMNHKEHKRRLWYREAVLSLLAAVNCCLAVLGMEYAWDPIDGINFDDTVQYLYTGNSVCVIVSMVILVEYYSYQAYLLRLKYKMFGTFWFWEVPHLRNSFLAELLLILIHPMPGFSTIHPRSYRTYVTYAVLTMLMFFRLYIPGRGLKHFYPLFSQRRQYKNYGVSFNWQFIGRTYCQYLAERVTQPDVYGKNCLWFTLVSMSTVGYGDLYPTSNFGRSVALFAAWIGIMVAAILTGIIVLQLQLSVVEKKTVDNFHLQLVNERLAVTAATILQTVFRRKKLRKLHGTTSPQFFKEDNKFSKKLAVLNYQLKVLNRVYVLLKAQIGGDADQTLIALRRIEEVLQSNGFKVPGSKIGGGSSPAISRLKH